tara:strand:- start:9 stop:1202 length:1194 start_codon:yes stop_codon:yes gene_type:complete
LSYKVCIIGGGIIGLSLAYKIQKRFPQYIITVLEKENTIGAHQSSNNSGVLHCGLPYKYNSLKARLSIDGIKQMVSFCIENKIDHDICGKIVVSTNKFEDNHIESVAANGKKNGLLGLKFLNQTDLKKREPNIRANKALLVPEEGIVNFKQVVNTLSNKILDNGGFISLNNKVSGCVTDKGKHIILTTKGEFECDLVINCSGLFSDRIYKKLLKKSPPFKIIPFRGEYYRFKNEYKNFINHLVYPVANPKFPFLGLHFTRMIDGKLTVGPNAVLAFKREGYKLADFSLYDFFDSVFYKGLYTFILKNKRFSIEQLSSSLFKLIFIKNIKKMTPDLKIDMLEKDYSGVRAQAIDINGNLIMDFKIFKENNQIHLLNAPSPGATASLAIADYIIENYIC